MTKSEEVKQFVEENKIEAEIIEHLKSPTLTCSDAAKVHGVGVGDIIKTLFLVDAKDPENVAAVIMQGDKKLDVKKIPSMRAPRFAKNDEVKKWLNAEIGGVPPLAIPQSIPTYLDSGVLEKSIVYGSAGATDNALKISPPELTKQPNTQVINLSKMI
jgi:prolyl-tRNA editing enzyme YbaK/EbsC (Cys-tRNA(Pro) deacylase)